MVESFDTHGLINYENAQWLSRYSAARLVLTTYAGGNDAFHDCGDSAGPVAVGPGQWIHTRQLHLCSAGDRARAVRGRSRRWPPDSLTRLSPPTNARDLPCGRPSGWPLVNRLAVPNLGQNRNFSDSLRNSCIPARA